MIDINELRRRAQAATPHVGHACKYQDAHWLREGHVDFENADLFIASERPQEDAEFYATANPATVIEIINRIEAAESDALEQARLNGMGSEREAALMAKLEVAEKERESWKGVAQQFGNEADELRTHLSFAKDELNRLRAKIEGVERQEPVAEMVDDDFGKQIKGINYWWRLQNGAKLYALPGAKGE